jgi:single-stranded DNA-binding protein
VKVWDGLADVAASLRKGDAVIVTGSLRHSVFDSNGVALERLEINDATLKKIAVDDVDRRLSDAAKDIKARGEKGGHESKSR